MTVPMLNLPLRPAISPHAAQLDGHVAGWMRRNSLYTNEVQLERYTRSNFGTFAARVCPGADLERLRLYAEWLAFGFFYDDQFFDEGELSTDPRAIADAVIAAVSVFAPTGPRGLPRVPDTDEGHRLDVLADLLARTAAIARPEQLSRFSSEMTLWFYSYLYEPLVQTAAGRPTLAGYAANRLYNIATAPYVALSEIVTGCHITAEELARSDVRELSALAAYEMAWCNDIHSAAREATVTRVVENLPSFIGNESVRVHDDTMRAYLDLERDVLVWASPGIREYLHLLRTWMRGHYDWCCGTHRYHGSSATPLKSA